MLVRGIEEGGWLRPLASGDHQWDPTMSSRGPRQPGAVASFGTLLPLAYPQGPVDLDPLLRPALARRTQQLDRSFDQHVRLTARLSRTVQVADRGALGAGVSPRGYESALERISASYGARVAHASLFTPKSPITGCSRCAS